MADLVAGRITRGEARERVARIVSTGHFRRRWVVTLGWGVMGTGVALTLGGSLVVCVLAFLGGDSIDRTQRLMSGFRIPSFYVQAAGGFVATLIAVSAAATPLEVNPSRVVTAGIVMLLAGVGLGRHPGRDDGVPGHGECPADRRHAGHRRHHRGRRGRPHVRRGGGSRIEDFKPGASGLAERGRHRARRLRRRSGVRVRVVRPTSGAGRRGSRGGARTVRPRSPSSARGSASPGGPAGAAITIGAVCYLVAGRFRVPPLVVVVPAIVPLLPGLQIYRGLALLAQGQDGVLHLASALGTAIALAAGVILGQYLANPSSGRRTDSRPGLGPAHGRTVPPVRCPRPITTTGLAASGRGVRPPSPTTRRGARRATRRRAADVSSFISSHRSRLSSM